MGRRILVTGGVRSGKSRHAESLFSSVPGVTYIATGYEDDGSDPEWTRRVARHQAQRPASWSTLETLDVADALGHIHGPVLVDCFGLWLTRTLDDLSAWDAPNDQWHFELESRIDRLTTAWRDFGHDAVGVTNEVGWGVVSEQRSGRVFADWLGRLNQRLAACSDEVVLLVAGRALSL